MDKKLISPLPILNQLLLELWFHQIGKFIVKRRNFFTVKRLKYLFKLCLLGSNFLKTSICLGYLGIIFNSLRRCIYEIKQDGKAPSCFVNLPHQYCTCPGIQFVPASGTRAIAAASTFNATRSSESRLCKCDLPHARAMVCASSTNTRR